LVVQLGDATTVELVALGIGSQTEVALEFCRWSEQDSGESMRSPRVEPDQLCAEVNALSSYLSGRAHPKTAVQ
jgi:hypothetical protein